VPVECVHDVSAHQVPDLEGGVRAAGEQLVAARVHAQTGDLSVVRVLVLDQSVAAEVEHLDFLVRRTGGDAAAVGVEHHVVYCTLVVLEYRKFLALVDVPEAHCLVV